MDFALAILIAALAGFLAFATSKSAMVERRRWQTLATALKLNVGNDRLVGIIDGYGVVVHKVENQPTFLIQVGGRNRLGSFSASRNDVVARVNAALSGEYVTGDPSFDRQVLLQGNDLEMAAAMTATGRAALSELVKLGIKVGSGSIALSVVRSELTIPGLQRKLDLLLSAAKRVSVPQGRAAIQARLIENALNDPVAGVRKKNLELLIPRARKSTEVMSAFRRALSDADPEVRLVAASCAELEPDDTHATTPLSVLRELVQDSYGGAVRGRAIALIAKRFPTETELFRAALHDPESSVRKAAAAALAKAGVPAETGGLTLADTDGGELSLSREEGAISAVSGTDEQARRRP